MNEFCFGAGNCFVARRCSNSIVWILILKNVLAAIIKRTFFAHFCAGGKAFL
jgi:hypothetical protein